MSIEQILKDAVSAHKLGKIREADKLYTTILKTEPNHPDANHNLGLLAVQVGKPKEAIPFLRTAVNVNPNIKQFWISYITTLVEINELPTAKNLLELVKQRFLDGELIDKLENIITSNVRVDTLKSKIEEQNCLNHMTLSQALRLAKIKNKENNHQDATRIYQDILEKFPKNKEAIRNLKRLSSQNSYVNVEESGSEQTELHELVRLYNAGNPQLVLEKIQKFLGKFPHSATAYNLLGACYVSMGNSEKAILSYMKAIEINPNYAEAYNNLGVALNEQKKFDKALVSYSKAIEIDRTYTEAHYNLGNLYKNRRSFTKAFEAYSKAIETNPNYINAYFNLGTLLQDEGRYHEAITAFEKTVNINPDHFHAHNNMGVAFERLGDLNKSLEAYLKALEINPDFSLAHYNMGATLKLKGEINQAIQAYVKAINIKPDFVDAWINVAEIFEKWNQLEKLEHWLSDAENHLSDVPADLKLYKAKLYWRKDRARSALKIITGISLDSISEIRKCDFLILKAKCFETINEFETAYSCFLMSNQITKKSEDFIRFNSESYLENLYNEIRELNEVSYGNTIRSKALVENEFSPVFLVGFPRSGTTLLDTILRSHPKVAVVEEKPALEVAKNVILNEIKSFDPSAVIGTGLVEIARKSYEEEFFKNATNITHQNVYIDKLPLNLLNAPLIDRLYPQAQFIFALRHPMDTILSCWMQNFEMNEAMANMVDLDRIVNFYCLSMEHFTRCVEIYKLDVHTIKYEDVVDNFSDQVAKLLNFLDVPWDEQVLNYRDTARKRGKIDTPSYTQVVRPIYTDAKYRWINYEKYLVKYKKQIKPWSDKFGYIL